MFFLKKNKHTSDWLKSVFFVFVVVFLAVSMCDGQYTAHVREKYLNYRILKLFYYNKLFGFVLNLYGLSFSISGHLLDIQDFNL